jgi:hypothetical protein
MDEVFPGLYVGTLTDAGDESVLQNYGIEKIVSLTYGDPESGVPDSVPVITVEILTEIPLKLSVAAVLTARSETAAKTGYTVKPADLLQEVRYDRFRPKHIKRNHSCRAPLTRCPCSLRLRSDRSALSTISYAWAKTALP